MDVGTQYTLDEARDLTRGRGRPQRQFIEVLDRFARRMDTFHDRVDDMETRRAALDIEVASLRTEARRVNTQLLRIAALRPLRDDWRAVMDGVDRMRRVVAGQRVTLPQQPTEWALADDEFDRAPAARVTMLTGRPLADFRAMAEDLSTRLQQFNRRTTDLHEQTDRGQLDVRVVDKIVDALLADAGKVDAKMRDTRIFMSTWQEWNRAMDILREMDRLVHN